MQEDYFNDFNEDYENLERKKLVQRFEKMLNENAPDFFDSDDFAYILEYYLYNSNTEMAQKVLYMGMKQYPDSYVLKIKKVDYLIYIQKPNEALKYLMEIDGFGYNDIDMLLEQAFLYSQLNQYDTAIEKYQEVLNSRDKEYEMTGDAYMGLSENYAQKGNVRMSLEYLKKAYELEPENEFLMSSVYDAYIEALEEEEKHEIVDYFNEIVKKYSFSSIAWACLGYAYYEVELYEKSIEAIDYSLALDETNEPAIICQMNAYFKCNDLKKAQETFHMLLNTSENTAAAWYHVGENFRILGEDEKALSSFQNAINENPDYALAYASQAKIYASQQNYEKAIEHMQKATEVFIDNIDYWLLLGEYLCADNRNDEAELIYQYVTEGFPSEPDVWLMYSDFHVSKNELDKAIQILFEGIDKQPDNLSYLYRMANYYFIKEDNEQATAYLNLAYVSDPELLNEFFEYDESMYDKPDVINFLSTIKDKSQ